jgi:hypothetical protein
MRIVVTPSAEYLTVFSSSSFIASRIRDSVAASPR